MKNVKVIASNSVSSLSDILVRNFANYTPADTLAPVYIVCRNAFFARELSLKLADNLGICANVKMMMPRKFIFSILKMIFDDFESQISGDELLWQIYGILEDLPNDGDIEVIRDFALNDKTNRRRYQFAQILSEIFDDYILFRPDLCYLWQDNKIDGSLPQNIQKWQKFIWHRIYKENKNSLFTVFLQKIKSGDYDAKNLKGTIPIFAPNALAPAFIDVIGVLSKHIDFDIYLQSPSPRYFEASEKQCKDSSYYASSLDKIFCDFTALLKNKLDYDLEEHYIPINGDQNGKRSSLNHAQSSFYGIQHDKEAVLSDGTIQIASCHSRIREIQALYDYILDTLENDKDLDYKDILVVIAGNMKEYFPLISAVFDYGYDGRKVIPYRIIDQRRTLTHPVITAFLQILDLSRSRFYVSDVLGILECREVRDRFNIGETEMELIEKWASDTNINWGIKGIKSELGLPEIDINTWSHGLRRMLLGYPMKGDIIYGDILAYDDIEGSDGIVLGKLLAFIQSLDEVSKIVKNPRKPWAEVLKTVIEMTITKSIIDINMLNNVVKNIDKVESIYDGQISFEVIRKHLENTLIREIPSSHYNKIGITISSFLSGSGLDKKVVAIIGLNDGEFPRRENKPDFDLMRLRPKAGDKDNRQEDRFNFLRVLQSTKERIYLSYIGQSIKDNSEIPPSIVLAEFIDHLCLLFGLSRGEVLDKILIKHRLQPFSNHYFMPGSKLYSYFHWNLRRTSDEVQNIGKVDHAEIQKEISVAQLIDFLLNPAKHFSENILDIRLKDYKRDLSDDEIFTFDYIQKYNIKADLIESQMNNEAIDKVQRKTYLSGRLPHGTPGETEFDNLQSEMSEFYLKIQEKIGSREKSTVEISETIGDWHLYGKITDIYDNERIVYRNGKLNGRDILRVWINHLALSIAEPQATSFFFGEKKTIRFGVVEKPKEILLELLLIYESGCKKALHFFPKSAFIYWEKINDSRSTTESAIQNAKNEYIGQSDRGFPEKNDEYFSHFFKDSEAINDKFYELAENIFKPILKNFEVL